MSVEEKFEQLMDILIGKMGPPEKSGGVNNRTDGHHMALFGANGMSGMVGEIMTIKQTLSKLDERTKSIGRWMKVGVSVTLFTLTVVLAHMGQEVKTVPVAKQKQETSIMKETGNEEARLLAAFTRLR